jgi:predicted glycosyltransferase
MGAADAAKLAAQSADRPGVRLLPFLPGLAGLVEAADVVVSMGGYNTVGEVLSFQRPAVIVPRTEPRQEQYLRARAFSRRGLVTLLHPDQATPEALRVAVESLLARPVRPHQPVSLEGLPALVTEIEALLDERTASTRPAAPALRTGGRP